MAYTGWVRRLVPCAALSLIFVLPLAACGGGGSDGPTEQETTSPPEAPTADDQDGVAATDAGPPGAVSVGDWSAYAAAPEEDWAVRPLDADRWAVTSAELACAGRANHGDPDALRAASRRILHHHETTAVAVMEFGIEVNADPERALRLGEVVASATERCR